MPNPDQLNLALQRSIHTLLAQQRDSGAMDGYCCSRLFESALSLHLLRSQKHSPEQQTLLKEYLITSIAHHGPEPSGSHPPIVTTMAQYVLGGGSVSVKDLLKSLSGREQGRKMLYFGCLLGEVGAVSFASLPFDASAFESRNQPVQTWARVMLCSLKVLYCYGVSQHHLVTADDQDFLTSRLRQSDIFENNVLTQIVGLLALSKFMDSEQLKPSLAALMQWQRADGGMPLMTGLDHFVTPLAGLAILESLPSLPTQLQPSAQRAVMDMADFLASVQAKDGGWSYMTGTAQTDVDDSGLCSALLAQIGEQMDEQMGNQTFEIALQRFHQYSMQMQNEDGGFPTYIKGNPSTPSMTAAALHGMAELGRCAPETLPTLQVPIQRAVSYLLDVQQKDGTFERRWSNAETHAMFRVAIALHSVQKLAVKPELQNTMATVHGRMKTYLARTQNPDGGWGQTPDDNSDANSTAYAILCAGHDQKELAAAGITFLLTQQASDGTIQSRPELLGPRPLLYDIPILTTIAVIHAYGYFLRTLSASSLSAVIVSTVLQ